MREPDAPPGRRPKPTRQTPYAPIAAGAFTEYPTMSKNTQPNGSDEPFDRHSISIPLDTDEHAAKSVDLLLTRAATAVIEDVDERAAEVSKDRVARALVLASELNERRTRPENLPVDTDARLGFDPSQRVDAFLQRVASELHQYTVNDAEMDDHLDAMAREVEARIKGGDA